MNILKIVINLPLWILQAIAFVISVVVCTILHFVIAFPTQFGSWLLLQNAAISRRLMAFALNIPYKELDAEIMKKIKDRYDDDPR